MEWLDTPGDWQALIGIGVVLLAGLMWLVRAEVRKLGQPNGGTSIKDIVNRIEADLHELRKDLHRHMEFHLHARRPDDDE